MDELEINRKKIEEIDNQMAKLFEERMLSVKEIALYKKEKGLPVYDKTREDALIKKNSSLVNDATINEYYVQFLKSVINTSKDYQNRIISGVKVAYSGAEGAFAYIAAQKLFPNANHSAFSSFEDAYRAVENGEFDYAILPIENSYAGDVGVVMDLMFSGSLYVNTVLELDVVHNLLIKNDSSIDKIKYVVSHPQALEQCENFIKEHGYEKISYSNTALAAKYVSEQCDETYGAIGSVETAKAFNLKVAMGGINSAKNNTTRFAVFSRSQRLPLATSKNENERFMLMFTAKNEAGSLAKALDIIGAHNFNMRSLRSRPMKELLWNYYFYVEAEGNVNTQNGKDMLRELSALCARLKLVGAYN